MDAEMRSVEGGGDKGTGKDEDRGVEKGWTQKKKNGGRGRDGAERGGKNLSNITRYMTATPQQATKATSPSVIILERP